MKHSLTTILALLSTVTFSLAQQGMGVGNNNPLEMLDVTGAIKIGTTAATPPGGAGTIRWNGANFQGWDGTQWINFGGGGTSWELTGNSGTVSGTNFLGTIDNVDFRIRTSNTDRFTVTSGGNVGIGTTTVSTLFGGNIGVEIKGDVPQMLFNDNTGGATDDFRIANGGAYAQFDNATTNTTIMSLGLANNSNNVGIGTTTPGQALHVYRSGSDAIIRVESPGNSNEARIEFWKFGSFNASVGFYPGTSDLRLRTGQASGVLFEPNGVEKMRVNANGNVGIGTTGPAELLEVIGTIKATNPGTSPSGSSIKLSSPANDIGVTMDRGNGSGSSQQRWDMKITSDNALRLRSQNANDYFAFTNTGNMGIGTMAPTEKLEIQNGNLLVSTNAPFTSSKVTIYGSRNGGGAPWNTASGGGPAILNFDNYDPNSAAVRYTGAVIESGNNPGNNDGNLRFLTANNMVISEAMRIDYTGNIGMGAEPTEKLHVVGHIRMVDGNQAVGYIPVSDGNGKMTWTNPATIATSYVDEVRDADNDTKIQVEESADEDIIRFDAAGTQLFTMRKMAGGSPWLEVNSSNTLIGQSISTAINGAGVYNTAVGFQSAQNLTTGQKNTYYGDNTGGSNATGNWNTMIGTVAGQFNNGGGANTMIGGYAGRNNLTGSGNVFLGFGAGENETNSNKLYIDNSNTTSPLIYGDFSSDILTVNGNLGIGTTSPTKKLDVRGDVFVNTGASSVITVAGSRNGGNTAYNSVNTTAPARIDFQNNDPGNGSTDYVAGRIESVNRPGNNDGELRFYTSQNLVLQEVMNINNVGNVGIGIIAAEKLHVVGKIRMADGNQAAGYVPVSDANGTMTWTAPSSITTANDGDWTISGNDQYSAVSGNVGIGTTTPDRLLNLESTTGAQMLFTRNDGATTDGEMMGELLFDNNSTSPSSVDAAVVIRASATGNQGNSNKGGYLSILTKDNVNGTATATERIRIAANGNVRLFNSNSMNFYDDSGATIRGTIGQYAANSDMVLASNVNNSWLRVGANNGGIAFMPDNTYAGGSNPAVLITSNKRMGIGTNVPIAPLHVESQTTAGNEGSYGNFWYYSGGGYAGGACCGGSITGVSIHASGRVMASEFDAFSDARIKKVVRTSNSFEDLSTLLGIVITDYTMKDKAKDLKAYKKVIAQQVEEVYPQAVSQITEVVPDIYTVSTITNGYVALSTDLKVGDRVKLIFDEGAELATVVSTDAFGFNIDLARTGNVFVYGREVSDFRTVDYEAISMLNVSATQELFKMIQELKEENAEMKIELKEFSSLKSDIELLKIATGIDSQTQK